MPKHRDWHTSAPAAPDEWTPELVLERLRDAAKIAAVCVKAPYPSSKVVATLETWREFCPEIDEARTRRKTATPQQISMMEETLKWMAEYVKCNKARAMLSQLAAARTLGGTFRAVCRARGWGKTQAYETCNINLRVIAGTLNRHGVAVRV